MIAILMLLLAPTLIVGWMGLMAFYHGWAISMLWGWFIVPLGLPAISAIHGYGLALIAGLFKGVPKTDKSEEEWYVGMLQGLLIPIIAVGFGWIAKMFL